MKRNIGNFNESWSYAETFKRSTFSLLSNCEILFCRNQTSKSLDIFSSAKKFIGSILFVFSNLNYFRESIIEIENELEQIRRSVENFQFTQDSKQPLLEKTVSTSLDLPNVIQSPQEVFNQVKKFIYFLKKKNSTPFCDTFNFSKQNNSLQSEKGSEILPMGNTHNMKTQNTMTNSNSNRDIQGLASVGGDIHTTNATPLSPLSNSNANKTSDNEIEINQFISEYTQNFFYLGDGILSDDKSKIYEINKAFANEFCAELHRRGFLRGSYFEREREAYQNKENVDISSESEEQEESVNLGGVPGGDHRSESTEDTGDESEDIEICKYGDDFERAFLFALEGISDNFAYRGMKKLVFNFLERLIESGVLFLKSENSTPISCNTQPKFNNVTSQNNSEESSTPSTPSEKNLHNKSSFTIPSNINFQGYLHDIMSNLNNKKDNYIKIVNDGKGIVEKFFIRVDIKTLFNFDILNKVRKREGKENKDKFTEEKVPVGIEDLYKIFQEFALKIFGVDCNVALDRFFRLISGKQAKTITVFPFGTNDCTKLNVSNENKFYLFASISFLFSYSLISSYVSDKEIPLLNFPIFKIVKEIVFLHMNPIIESFMTANSFFELLQVRNLKSNSNSETFEQSVDRVFTIKAGIPVAASCFSTKLFQLINTKEKIWKLIEVFRR